MGYVTLNLDHPEILRAILAGILETGHVLGREGNRTILEVKVADWLFDELAAIEDGTETGDDELAV